VAVASAGPRTNHLQLTPDNDVFSFYRLDVKALKASSQHQKLLNL